MKEDLDGIAGLLLIGAIIWGGYNLFFKSDQWLLLYETSGQTIMQGGYGSREECLDELDAIRGQYFGAECSKNCERPKDSSAPWLCEESVDG